MKIEVDRNIKHIAYLREEGIAQIKLAEYYIKPNIFRGYVVDFQFNKKTLFEEELIEDISRVADRVLFEIELMYAIPIYDIKASNGKRGSLFWKPFHNDFTKKVSDMTCKSLESTLKNDLAIKRAKKSVEKQYGMHRPQRQNYLWNIS